MVAYRKSICPSVRQSKTVEVRIMQFSPHSTPPPLSCLQYKFHREIPTGSPRAGTSNEGGTGMGKRTNIVGVLTLSPGGSTS